MNFNRKLSVTALAFIIATGCATAQVKKKPNPSPKQKPVAGKEQLKPAQLPVDKDVVIGKLHNGLTYYIRHNEQPQ